MEYVRLALGSVLFTFLVLSLHKAYWHYNKKNIIEGITEDFFKFTKFNSGNILFLFPECHSTDKGKYWAKVHGLCWLLVATILVVGLFTSEKVSV